MLSRHFLRTYTSFWNRLIFSATNAHFFTLIYSMNEHRNAWISSCNISLFSIKQLCDCERIVCVGNWRQCLFFFCLIWADEYQHVVPTSHRYQHLGQQRLSAFCGRMDGWLEFSCVPLRWMDFSIHLPPLNKQMGGRFGISASPPVFRRRRSLVCVHLLHLPCEGASLCPGYTQAALIEFTRGVMVMVMFCGCFWQPGRTDCRNCNCSLLQESSSPRPDAAKCFAEMGGRGNTELS